MPSRGDVKKPTQALSQVTSLFEIYGPQGNGNAARDLSEVSTRAKHCTKISGSTFPHCAAHRLRRRGYDIGPDIKRIGKYDCMG